MGGKTTGREGACAKRLSGICSRIDGTRSGVAGHAAPSTASSASEAVSRSMLRQLNYYKNASITI